MQTCPKDWKRQQSWRKLNSELKHLPERSQILKAASNNFWKDHALNKTDQHAQVLLNPEHWTVLLLLSHHVAGKYGMQLFRMPSWREQLQVNFPPWLPHQWLLDTACLTPVGSIVTVPRSSRTIAACSTYCYILAFLHQLPNMFSNRECHKTCQRCHILLPFKLSSRFLNFEKRWPLLTVCASELVCDVYSGPFKLSTTASRYCFIDLAYCIPSQYTFKSNARVRENEKMSLNRPPMSLSAYLARWGVDCWSPPSRSIISNIDMLLRMLQHIVIFQR